MEGTEGNLLLRGFVNSVFKSLNQSSFLRLRLFSLDASSNSCMVTEGSLFWQCHCRCPVREGGLPSPHPLFTPTSPSTLPGTNMGARPAHSGALRPLLLRLEGWCERYAGCWARHGFSPKMLYPQSFEWSLSTTQCVRSWRSTFLGPDLTLREFMF